MGLSQSEFWLMSPREFFNLLEGWNKAKEWEEKQAWERARYIAKACVSVHVSKKDKGKLEKAFKLPWDGEGGRTAPRVKKLTPEELAHQEAETIRIAKKLEKILG